jgi:hypothetical protein
MAWQPTKPQATDQLSVSQADIQGNFQALNGILNVVNPTVPTISLALIVGDPAPIATGLEMYVKTDGAHPQLFIQRETASADVPTIINVTGGHKDANGWTYLPSGILMLWGTHVLPGVTAAVTATFLVDCPTFPGFAAVYSCQITPSAPAGPNALVYPSALTLVDVTVQSVSVATSFYYLVIGR